MLYFLSPPLHTTHAKSEVGLNTKKIICEYLEIIHEKKYGDAKFAGSSSF